MSGCRLLVDVGGTNVRFARGDASGAIEHVRAYRTADFARFGDALARYLGDTTGAQDVEACAIGAAGPVDDGRVKLTNGSWEIVAADVSRDLANASVRIVNDLEAVAAALPHLTAADVAMLGGPAPSSPPRRTMLALNIGTGLGAAWVAQCDGVWRTFPSEGGHIAFGRVAPDEDDILPPDLTAEDVLSGYGVCALYDRVAARFGTRSQTLSDASQIFARAGGSAPEPAAARTVALLDRFIGRIAGDLVLTTGAWGGVYLCGSVAVAWSTLGDTAAFRTAFEAKGAMAARMADVPALVIRKPDVALSGLASMPL